MTPGTRIRNKITGEAAVVVGSPEFGLIPVLYEDGLKYWLSASRIELDDQLTDVERLPPKDGWHRCAA